MSARTARTRERGVERRIHEYTISFGVYMITLQLRYWGKHEMRLTLVFTVDAHFGLNSSGFVERDVEPIIRNKGENG